MLQQRLQQVGSMQSGHQDGRVKRKTPTVDADTSSRLLMNCTCR